MLTFRSYKPTPTRNPALRKIAASERQMKRWIAASKSSFCICGTGRRPKLWSSATRQPSQECSNTTSNGTRLTGHSDCKMPKYDLWFWHSIQGHEKTAWCQAASST